MAECDAMEVDGDHKGPVFVSYSGEDTALVAIIQQCLNDKGVATFVASSSINAGTLTIDAIVHGLQTSRKGLFLVTQTAMASSWFAFETILALERSQQLGRIGAVILLHGVTEEQLPKFAMFDALPKFTLDLDGHSNWKEEQVQAVKAAIEEEKPIDCILPVGNIGHAQAWSHYFGFHNLIHAELEKKIKESIWYKENPENMPIVVYEMVPRSCKTPSMITGTGITHVGALQPILVTRAGNVARPYELNVYSIEDGGQKYYCIAQYPNVISAIHKMQESPLIDMDEEHKALQLARFYYTLNVILQNSREKICNKQTRLLWFDDDSGEAPRDVLLKAIKMDKEAIPFDSMPNDLKAPLLALEDNDMKEKEYDAAFLYDRDDEEATTIKENIETYLQHKPVTMFTSSGPILGSLSDAVKKVRWLILILSQNGLSHDVFKMQAIAVLNQCIKEKKLRIIPVVDDRTKNFLPDMLRWVTYVNVCSEGYPEQIYKALKGGDIPLTLDPAHIPAGNLGYGLAWGYLVNYLKTVLAQFGPFLQTVIDLNGNAVSCPQILFLLVPKSCKCTKRISNKYVEHYSSFGRIDDNLGGANIIKSLDMYYIEDNSKQKHYFIGQYPAPVLCLWEMNECRIAGINEEAMRREKDRFCETFNSLLKGAVGEGLYTKCELIAFDDADPEDLQRKLVPELHKGDQLMAKKRKYNE